MKHIEVRCQGAGTLPLDQIHEFQGDLKVLTDERYAEFKEELERDHFSFPFDVWLHEGKYWCIDGHGRKKTIQRMKEEGYTFPETFPVSYIFAESVQEAKHKLLARNAQYGQMTELGLAKFAVDALLDLKDFDDLPLSVDFAQVEQAMKTVIVSEHERHLVGTEAEADVESEPIYTKKLATPIYEPKCAVPPAFAEMVCTDKTNSLIERIKAAGLSDDLTNFLVAAAHRHTVFNYENIAEFYCHATKEVQTLMEESALVIIDFKRAIELGFVSMTEEIIEAYNDNTPQQPS